MLTLTYGYKKPEAQDLGTVVFPAMEENLQRLNDHTHNGVNSAPLTAVSVVPTFQSVLSAAWVLVANGIYKQTVTMPTGLVFENTSKEYRILLGAGVIYYPTIVRLSTTSYEIYINDNTLAVTVAYK